MNRPDDPQDPRHRRPARSEEELHPSAYSERNPAPGADNPGADLGAELDEIEEQLLAEALGDEPEDEELDESDDAAALEGASAFDALLPDDMHIARIADLDDLDELDEIEDLEELELLGEVLLDEVTAARNRLTVAQLMARLRTEAESLDLRDLFVLSDLSRGEMALVQEQLPLVPVEHRRRLVRELTRVSDDFIELQLGRLLRVAMHDVDAAVRRFAVEGLWEETDADLIGPLTALLANDPDVTVRAAAAAALGPYVLAGELDELDSSITMRAEQALLAVLQTPGEPIRVQARALESLSYSSEAGMRQLIEEAYYNSEEEMRLSALRAMGRSADTRWRSLARAELSSPDAAMRAEAARACGELEVVAATQELIDLLDDAEAIVRLAAIDALGHLGGKQARDALRLVAAEGEEAEAAAAEVALEEMLFLSDADGVPLLDDDEDEEDDSDPDSDSWNRSARRGG